MTGVRSVETQIQSATAPTCSAMGMTKPNNTGYAWDAQTKISCDLMVLALQCDATRSISFMLGNGGNSCASSFPWLQINGDHHGLAHGQDANALPKIDAWHVSQLAYFCQKLDAIDEGGASILDNSFVFMSSEIMNGISHDQDNKGILLLGTAGGKIKSGQHILYAKAPQGNLFVTMLNALAYRSRPSAPPARNSCRGCSSRSGRSARWPRSGSACTRGAPAATAAPRWWRPIR
jgi:hypothetical protein